MPGQSAGRVVGVTTPESLERAPDGVPDLTVMHLKELRMFGVQYTENGKVKGGMFIKDGDQWYRDPSGGDWVNRLQPLSDKLGKSAMSKFDNLQGLTAKDLPMEDNVDIVANEGGK